MESFREFVYPILHEIFVLFNFYAKGKINEDEYVGTIPVSEEKLEEVFHDTGVVRNALAKYKSLPDGRRSSGSWRLTHKTHPDFVEDTMQIHITLFEPRNDTIDEAVDVYAHYEMNYAASIWGHLSGKGYSAEEGVERARRFFYNRTGYELENRR